MGQLSTIIKKNFRWLLARLAYFLHKECLLCRCFLAQSAWGLCKGCEADLPWLNVPCCLRCAQPVDECSIGEKLLCEVCRIKLPLFTTVSALFAYTYPIPECLACFKYKRQREVGRWLAKLFYNSFIEKQISWPQALVPVPLHYKKLRQRGFNQAYELCYFFKLDITVETNWIVKKQQTVSQTQKSKQQRKNQLKGVFSINHKEKRDYQHVAIVDDVMTTGATVRALTELLKESGVEKVEVWVLARA